MTDPFTAVLAVLVILEVKHFFCDYPLQTSYHLLNKGTYGHPGGIFHSGIHAIGTAVSFLVVPPTLLLGVLILVGEFLIHYHVDWSKDQIIRRMRLTSTDRGYWWAIGADQLVHHLTYIAIAAILVYEMLVAA